MKNQDLKGKTFRAIAALTILLSSSAAGQVVAQTPTATLKVSGDVTTPLSLTPADIKGLPRTKVEGKAGDRVAVYEGVRISEILKKSGVPLGGDQGRSVAMYVLATASDGYQAVFSIGEIDPELTSNDIIVADTVDGKPLSAEQGQFRIVAPKDVKGARSMRMLDRLEVVRIKK